MLKTNTGNKCIKKKYFPNSLCIIYYGCASNTRVLTRHCSSADGDKLPQADSWHTSSLFSVISQWPLEDTRGKPRSIPICV